MKTLIITAAPHKTSFTHNIAKSYLEKNKDSEIIDLYDEKYSQKFLKFENMREMPKDSVKDLIQKKMSEVDEYVFVFPVWWG
jgi:putative NADPH-quinone reductase